jgi:hypothetical protein
VLFFLLVVWLPRNGAKASLASRSGVQRQPKWAPIRGGFAAGSGGGGPSKAAYLHR